MTQPEGATRPATSRECHGNDAFCSRCSPRNPDRLRLAPRPKPEALRETLDRQQAVAEAAMEGREWVMTLGAGGYPQSVLTLGNVTLVAECYEGPEHPPVLATFISTFDPPTVMALLADAAALARVRRYRTNCAIMRMEPSTEGLRKALEGES